jgi:hypothetical protein
MIRKITILISGLVIGGSQLVTGPMFQARQEPGTAPVVPANPPAPSNPARILNAALRDLEQARVNDDLAAHKAAAIKACVEAIKQVKEGMKSVEEKK